MEYRRKAVLEFTAGEEDHPKISILGRPDSTLRESYRNAIGAVLEIIRKTREYYECYSESERLDSLHNYYNNMVLFSAPRGCGKSSAMFTFSRFLRDRTKLNHAEVDDFTTERVAMSNQSFVILEPIDPTILDEKHDVFSIVLSKLLNYASEKWETAQSNSLYGSSTGQQKMKADIIQQFRKCQTAIYSMHKGNTEEDDWSLDTLSQLGSVSMLKSNFFKLVQKILDLGSFDVKTSHIVIQIDDADMNFRAVSDTLEYIRSYMMVPNVIILLAADMEMISKIVYNKFVYDYHTVGSKHLQSESISEVDKKLLVQLTEQYILKFFPPKRQIHLPDIREFTQIEPERLFYRRLIGNKTSDTIELEKGLLDEIFVRTGLVFKMHAGYHYILPETQRGIGQLLAYLDKMKKIPHLQKLMLYSSSLNRLECNLEKGQYFYYAFNSEGDKRFREKHASLYPNDPCLLPEDSINYMRQLEDWMQNVAMFRDYFMNEWIRANLSMENQEFMTLLHMARMSEKNGILIKLLKQRGRVEDQTEEASYTYMLRLLKEYQLSCRSEQLEFAVHVYYSIVSQQIVLSRLIDFYAQLGGKNLEEAKTLADFTYLYNLYGSEYGVSDEGQLVVKDHANIEKILTKWNINRKEIDNKSSESGSNERKDAFYQSKCASLFVRDFWAATRTTDILDMSIYAPILNCLFLYDIKSKAESVPECTIESDRLSEQIWDDLRGMQDIALRLVVNYDYRAQIEKIRAINGDRIVTDIPNLEDDQKKGKDEKNDDTIEFTILVLEFFDEVEKTVIHTSDEAPRIRKGIAAWGNFKTTSEDTNPGMVVPKAIKVLMTK